MLVPEPTRTTLRPQAASPDRLAYAQALTDTLSHRVAFYLYASGIALYMLLSGPTLFHFGILYDAPGGSALAKVHPGTWLVLIGFALLVAQRGNPLRVGWQSLTDEPLLGVYAVCQFSVLLWMLVRYGGPGTVNVFETLLMPFYCVATARMLDADSRYRVLSMIVTLLVINTLIGFAESGLQVRLIPLQMGGEEEIVEDIFRPSALLGHPLTNSIITATLLPAVMYLRLSMFARFSLMLVLWIGTIAFGGRTGFLLATFGFGAYFVARLALRMWRGQFTYLQLTGGGVAATAGATAVAFGITASGVGERIFKSLSWDGSADVRLRIWNALDFVHGQDLIIGISPAELLHVGAQIGLESSESIENFWLIMFLLTGWMGFVPFVVGMGAVFAWLWASTQGAMRIAVPIFFAIASSTNSLATKTVALTLFMTVVALGRKQQFAD